jgi:RHS repeat-associated protein
MGSLIAVNLPDGRLIEYVTDGQGRRIAKSINGIFVRQWLYGEVPGPIAELDGAGNLLAQFIYGSKYHVPDLVIRNGTTYKVVSDQLGSPLLAINTGNSSDVPFQATYSAYGKRTITSGADDWMPFGFAGGPYDADTGLSRFGYRDYNPDIGRWLDKDPLRFQTGVNFYVYAANDPVNFIDISGLAPASPSGGQIASCILCRAVALTIGAACKTLKNPICLVGTVPCSYACSYVCQGIDTDFLTGSGPVNGPNPGPQTGSEGTSGKG